MTGQPADGITGRTPLEQRLIRRIARHGPISIADFMGQSLADPNHGYYMAGDPLGARGDFITAPEISQMFGELIGLWCADTWQKMGSPSAVLLVELGPGRGTLMADALRACRVLPGLLDAVEIHLIEISPALQSLQARLLADYPVSWHERFAAIPAGRPAIVIANEFFDALPIRQFERTPQGWSERMIGLAPGGLELAFGLSPPTPEARPLIPTPLLDGPPGTVVEVSATGLSLITEIGRRLLDDGGAALIVDYGYAEADGKPTLQAVGKHRPQGVLRAPGAADLTAHVDFGTLAQAASETGCKILGPVEQGRFLSALGIEARAERLLVKATPTQAREIRGALSRLTAADEMGALFKAFALTAPGLGPLAGFPD